MSCIEIVNGKRKEVKNLAYLVRKAGKATRLFAPYQIAWVNTHGSVLTVAYTNGDLHQSTWASESVMENWIIHRRALRGIPVRHDVLPLV